MSTPFIYRAFPKRVLDIVGSFFLLVLFSPIFIFVTLLLVISKSERVFFTQERSGLKGKPFELVKFQTMSDARDSRGELLSENSRITKVGNFLRKTSLDELPQLLNVLRGEMSIIGPRPLLSEYLPLYNEMQLRRFDVRPGITGLAQVRGRNLLSWEEKFSADVEYVEQCSLSLDIKIAFATIGRVILGSGVSPADAPVIEKFKGGSEKCAK